FDAVVLAGGSTVPRNLETIPGHHLNGVHFAMDFLSQQNKRVAATRGSEVNNTLDHQGRAFEHGELLATGKNVVVIGGGDTGSDCVGTSNRHKAKSITQIEIMPVPPSERDSSTPWPEWPKQLRTSSSHEEGCDRYWSLNTKEFVGDENGSLKTIKLIDVKWVLDNGRMKLMEIEGSEREIPCELVLVAAGFLHPEKKGLIEELELELDGRGNIQAQNYQTSKSNIFAAGDMRRGQSLVVWAISEGREAARAVDEYLMGSSMLEAKAVSMMSDEFMEV
ncbi:MAG: FAD-dependent oxidoreductase, partial [Spirosomataceae bacterium]